MLACQRSSVHTSSASSGRFATTAYESPLRRSTDDSVIEYDNIVIEAAREDEASDIAKIVSDAFSTGDVFRKPDCPRLTETEVSNQMRAPGHTWIVLKLKAENIRQIAATILYVSESPTEASTHFLAADPNHRGKKYGVYLRQFCDQKAREEGKSRLTFLVASVNTRLIEYYKNQGYSLTDDVEDYFQEALRPEWQGNDESGKPKVQVLRMEKVLQE